MKQAQLDALIAELGGKDARESVTAWFMPSFHPECGVVLVRDGTGWRGWWVATLRVPGGDPVLRWLDPTTSREPLPLAEGDINALVRQVREACRTEPAKSGEIILDGCVFRLDVRTGAETAGSPMRTPRRRAP